MVLLDEIEKAHPKIFDLFLQVFDDGIITDSAGRTIDVKNAIFIMTSNLTLSEDTGFETAYGIHEQKPRGEFKVNDDLLRSFKPEFINRINEIIVFNSLKLPEITKITRIMIEELKERLLAQKIYLKVGDPVIKFIARNGFDPVFGARPLRRVIGRLLEDPLSDKLISGEIQKTDRIKVGLSKNEIQLEVVKSYFAAGLIS